MEIEYVKGEELQPAPWRSTYVLKPDLKVLQQSLEEYGWLEPIIVNRETMEIIDGYHRVLLAGTSKKIRRRDKGMIPVRFVECDTPSAMLMHLRLNRGRGALFAKGVSAIVKIVVKSRMIDTSELREILAMSREEFDLMLDGTLLKQRKIENHTYSKAWIPIEAPAGAAEQKALIERPPNADR